MADQTLPITVPPAPWSTAGQKITWTVADGTDDYIFASTGREILHAKCGTGPVTLTIPAQADSPFGRHATGDNFAQVLATGEEWETEMLPRAGWADSTGHIRITAPSAQLSFYVEMVPV